MFVVEDVMLIQSVYVLLGIPLCDQKFTLFIGLVTLLATYGAIAGMPA